MELLDNDDQFMNPFYADDQNMHDWDDINLGAYVDSTLDSTTMKRDNITRKLSSDALHAAKALKRFRADKEYRLKVIKEARGYMTSKKEKPS
jgi:hypothetical protein